MLQNTLKCHKIIESPHDKTNKMTYAPSKDLDQPGHPSSLTRVFAVRLKKAWVLSYPLSAQQRLWSDWADAQADLSLCWVYSHFVGFVMRCLKYLFALKVSDMNDNFRLYEVHFKHLSRLMRKGSLVLCGLCSFKHTWAMTCQSQLNECAPSEDSDQPRHPPSLIRDFAVHSVGS